MIHAFKCSWNYVVQYSKQPVRQAVGPIRKYGIFTHIV
jgi:hypothetical protein